MESNYCSEKVTFSVLQSRLVGVVNTRIRNGDFTERNLARILGISQPQMHNVLKGARKLQPWLADLFLLKLDISFGELIQEHEICQLIQPDRSFSSGLGSLAPGGRDGGHRTGWLDGSETTAAENGDYYLCCPASELTPAD